MDMEVEEPKYSFQFENYKDTLCGNLIKYLSKKCFVNVTLVCDGEAITAHQVVLSACSEFFENILIARAEPHPVIVFVDIPKIHMELLSEFMYKGQISVFNSLLPSLLRIAKKLQIQGLNYDRFDNLRINSEGKVYVTNTPQESSPVLIETLRQNITVQTEVQNIEGQGLHNEESPKWLPSSTPRKRERGKKIINPFAMRSQNISDGDSTRCNFDPCEPGPSKNNFNEHPSLTIFLDDSDKEMVDFSEDTSYVPLSVTVAQNSASKIRSRDKNVTIYPYDSMEIDNISNIVVTAVAKLNDSSSDKQNRGQKCGRTAEASNQISEVEFTSKDSEIIISERTKKVKKDVMVTQNKSRDKNVESEKSEIKQTLKIDNDTMWRLEYINAPFDDSNREAFCRKFRNFCVVCEKMMDNKNHYKEHKRPIRKKITCETCKKSFYREKVLEIHKCTGKK